MSFNQVLADQPQPEVAGSAVILGEVRAGAGAMLAQGLVIRADGGAVSIGSAWSRASGRRYTLGAMRIVLPFFAGLTETWGSMSPARARSSPPAREHHCDRRQWHRDRAASSG